MLLDRTDPKRITAAAAAIIDACRAWTNNAGVMQTPESRTPEGFELQFSTNRLGHFRLNRLLLAHVEQSKGRIFGGARGRVGKASVTDSAHDEVVARALWEKTEGVRQRPRQ